MKKLKLLSVIVASALILASCKSYGDSESKSTGQSSSQEKQQVDITVITSYGGDDGNRLNYEKAVRSYEASTGNTVKDDSGISNEEWKSKIVSGFETGTEPDVLFYFTGADSDKIISDGKVVSVDEIREAYPDYASNMKDDMLAVSPVDGKNYAIPVNGYWEGLFVNKKVIEDCGVEIPNANTTWEQFLSDCQKIADKGYIPIAASLGEVPHYWFEFCVFNNGNLENHQILPASSSDDSGKAWAAGLYDIKNLYEKGFFPDDTLTMTSTEADTLIINDRAAFMIEGSWKTGWFAENASDINNFTVTYVPGKAERSSSEIIGGISMGYFITKKAWDNPEKREACVEFVKHMTSDEVVSTFGTVAITALKNGVTPPSESNNLIKDALNMTKNITGIAPAAADNLSLDSRSNLFANVKKIVTGEITAEEAITQCLDISN